MAEALSRLCLLSASSAGGDAVSTPLAERCLLLRLLTLLMLPQELPSLGGAPAAAPAARPTTAPAAAPPWASRATRGRPAGCGVAPTPTPPSPPSPPSPPAAAAAFGLTPQQALLGTHHAAAMLLGCAQEEAAFNGLGGGAGLGGGLGGGLCGSGRAGAGEEDAARETSAELRSELRLVRVRVGLELGQGLG